MPLTRVPTPVDVRVVMQVGCMSIVLMGRKVLVYAKAIVWRHGRVSVVFAQMRGIMQL